MNSVATQGDKSLSMVGAVLALSGEGSASEDKDDDWNALFTLRLSMLPSSYIPATLAQKILFIGKAVKVLQSKKTPLEDRIPSEELQCFSQAIIRLQNLPQFNVVLFQKVIEEIRECVACRLWHLTVIKADLMEDLRGIKDYFLLAKGEFYQTFLQEAR